MRIVGRQHAGGLHVIVPLDYLDPGHSAIVPQGGSAIVPQGCSAIVPLGLGRSAGAPLGRSAAGTLGLGHIAVMPLGRSAEVNLGLGHGAVEPLELGSAPASARRRRGAAGRHASRPRGGRWPRSRQLVDPRRGYPRRRWLEATARGQRAPGERVAGRGGCEAPSAEARRGGCITGGVGVRGVGGEKGRGV